MLGLSKVIHRIGDLFAQNEPPSINAQELFAPAVTLGGKHAEDTRIAMDNQLNAVGVYNLIQGYIDSLDIDGVKSIAFMGYPVLSMMEQNPLMRIAIETLGRETTRRWVELKTGKDNKDNCEEKAEKISIALEKYKIRSYFRDAAETTGFMGGCAIFIDTGNRVEELSTPLILEPQRHPCCLSYSSIALQAASCRNI